MAESNSTADALINLIRGQLVDVNTAIPGVIVSYANGRAGILPSVKKRFADGDVLDFPIIQNVRVCWPSFAGGSAGVKGPIKPGDKCLLIFSQQAVDGSDDRRVFDLQDAYAVMCDLGNSGAGDSGNNSDMTMFFGSASIRLTSGGSLVINAPGGTTINTPSTMNTGTLTTNGAFTYQSGMNGTGIAVLVGPVTQTGGGLSSNGVEFGSHTHSGVESGGDNSGPPNG
jgi:phage baseplate assembly protein gpV